MAEQEAVKQAREKIDAALEFQNKQLDRRNDWGSITFEVAKPDYDRIFTVLNHLHVLPLEYLSDTAITQIQDSVDAVHGHLGKIDAYNIEQGNPTDVRDALVNGLHSITDTFYNVVTPWIPFLAYQKGDVSSNIESLNRSVGDAEKILDEVKASIAGKEEEIESIVTQAREASAGAGAAVFTQDFLKAAEDQDDEAKNWLYTTGVFVAITFFFAVVLWFFADPGLNALEAVQKFGSKLAVLIVLFTATLWCGKNYKALRHQATNNRHRALSLQTFQAFSAAAADDSTRNAVLLETTRSIFNNTATGFIDSQSGSNNGTPQVVEIVRSVISQEKE